jgi:hypothetical protein
MNGRGAFFLWLILPAGWLSAEETAAFLRILPGARPMAMGQAFTAVAEDLNALDSNPAGLARLKGRQVLFSHADLFEGARYDFLGYAQPLASGSLGVSARRLSHGTLEGRDANRLPTGPFSAADTALSAAYSSSVLGGRALAGLQVKLIESRLANATARTAAVDGGLVKDLSVWGLPASVGAAFLNLGRGLRFDQTRNELPLILSAGAALKPAREALFSADLRHRPHAGKSTVSFGAEYSMAPAVALRAGYEAFSGIGSGALGGLGLGVGLHFGKATLDYAFSPAGDLGNTQRVSVSMRF